MNMAQRNWAGNITYQAQHWHQPESLEALQTLVQREQQVKVVGSRHSFNHIADNTHNIIEMTDWNQVIDLDTEQQTVTVAGAIRYGDLAVYLDTRGYALHNLASLPHISVAGAISTATHGSGVNNANLASVVTALELVTADGNLLTLSSDQDIDRFAGAVVGLGAIGIITKITLKIEPAYDMRQNVYLNLPFTELESNFDVIMSSGYSVSLFTAWRDDAISQVWVKSRASENVVNDSSFFGASPATKHYHPLPDLPAENCTQQLGMVGRWHERLPHFRMDFTPSNGEELQSEYFVARDNAVPAIQAVNSIRDQITPHLFISEIRTIAADKFWMSPCYQQDCVAIHFTWKPNWAAVRACLPVIEEALMPFNVRPHWGKLFTLPHSYLRSQYEKWGDFTTLVQDLDPNSKFRNAFLNQVLFGIEV
jgi:xylitol oxidase